MLNFEDLHKSRRDTRHFTSEEVPDDVLKKALQAGHSAPSVGLTDATRYYIIRSQEVKTKIKELFEEYNVKAKDLITSNEQKVSYANLKLEGILEAPVGLLVCYDRSVLDQFTIGTIASNDTIKFSAVCAVQNIWLSLTEQGFSMGWVSILNYYRFKQILDLPPEIEPLGYFCIGRPATDYEQQPMLQQMGWKTKNEVPEVREINSVKVFKEILPSEKVFQSADQTILEKQLQFAIDNKTKPVGALGKLEKLAKQIGLVFNTLNPEIEKPHLLVFAADHGIAAHGVSAYPPEVTRQMVNNFLEGGAAVNVFCRQHDIKLLIIDAGVNYDFAPSEKIINHKVGMGTRSFLTGPAMSESELQLCFDKGAEIVQEVFKSGCNTLALGEMGIGNTSSAAALMSVLCKLPIENCIGRGTGLNELQFQKKQNILKTAVEQFAPTEKIEEMMAYFGGFEIMQMAGAILEARKNNMLILIDGFISSVAFLCAFKIEPGVKDNAIFCHQSEENGHKGLLGYLDVQPVVELGMRLGEGSGCAVVFPIIQSAVAFLNEMASFENAGISNKI